MCPRDEPVYLLPVQRVEVDHLPCTKESHVRKCMDECSVEA